MAVGQANSITPPLDLPATRASIIIVLYNGAFFIRQCLQSILETLPSAVEVLVVDNASTDAGPAMVAAEFPQVKLLPLSSNRGYAGGINAGLKSAAGQYIVALNMDIRVTPGWLDALLEVLEERPDVGAVTPLILLEGTRDTINTMGGAIHVSGLSFCQGLGTLASDGPREPFSVPGLSGACFAMRRARLLELGGAPEECFMGNDDVVLSWLLRLVGDEILCVPRAVVYHDFQLSLDAEKLKILERNRLSMLFTTLELPTLLLMFPGQVMLETAILTFCVWKGPDFVQAKRLAWKEVWQERQALRHRRTQRQALRKVSDWTLLSHFRLRVPWQQLLEVAGPTRGRRG